VQGVRERLGERFRLLASGSRAAVSRHEGLHTALDWSHGLLNADEQIVFRRLGVFSGGWTLEAAQQVAADSQIDTWAVLDHLSALVDKSLMAADAGDPPRLSFLDSTRAYALEKLARANETDALARRHAEYFAACFERHADALYRGTLISDSFIQLRARELDNLRAAIEWSLGPKGVTETALGLLAHTGPFSSVLPLNRDSQQWWKRLLLRNDLTDSPRRVALAWYAWMMWSWWWEPPGAIPDPAQISGARAELVDDDQRRAHALHFLCTRCGERGEIGAANALIDRFTALERPDWPSWLRALRVIMRANADLGSGRPTIGLSGFESVLADLERSGEGAGYVAFAIRRLQAAHAMAFAGAAEAIPLYRAVLEHGREQRAASFQMSLVLNGLAIALTEQDQLSEARALILEALPHIQLCGTSAFYAPGIAYLTAKRGRSDTAARLLGAADSNILNIEARSVNARRCYARALAIVEAAHSEQQIAAWLKEGTAIGEEEFMRLVREEG